LQQRIPLLRAQVACIEQLPAIQAFQFLQAVPRQSREPVVRPTDASGQLQFDQALVCVQGLEDLVRFSGEEF
jgi:hypothetical protein